MANKLCMADSKLPVDTLKRKSSKQKVLGKSKKTARNSIPISVSAVYEDEYEVERILDHTKSNDKVTFYCVKWKGWSEDEATWEPLDNLRSSLATIADYYQKRTYPGRENVLLKSCVEQLRIELSQLNEDVISEFCSKYLTDHGHVIRVNEVEVEENLEILSKIPPFARDKKMIEVVRRPLQLLEFKKRRETQLELLRMSERDINNISTDRACVQVYNGVDLDTMPINFHYVNDLIPDFDVVIPQDNPVLCECSGQCFNNCCCWVGQSIASPYNKDGLLNLNKGSPVFECNKQCKCGPDCGNRVLQKGRTVPVAIFKTSNGCGWGVKTLVDIKKGTFVSEYVGEVVKFDTAELRGKTYDKVGCTYLFDLDFNDESDVPYTVDAAMYGNVSHFFNHSCDPNLSVFAVWVDCLDRNLPRLGLFASRNIKAFEQLTFDYMIEKKTPTKKSSTNNEKQTICRCESKNCRKIAF